MRRYSALLLVFLILSACSNSGGGPSVEPGDDTRIVFVNGNDFGITVYSDSNRTVKLAKASAGGESESVEAVPNSAAVFYLSYHILIDGQEFLYNYDLLYRIDAEKTNRVIVEDLSKLDPAELGKSLIAGVRIKIQNSSTSSLVLMRSNIEEKPQGADSPIIIPGETALYEVNSGSVSNYSFMRNSAVPIAFPAAPTEFVSSHLYSFKFDGNNLTLLEDIPLTIAQALKTVIKVPAGLKVTGQTKDSISLSWEAVSGVDGYSLTRSGGSGGPSAQTTASTSYTDTGLTPDTTYSYEVTAYKGSAQSAPAAISGKTLPETLDTPAGLTITGQTQNSISLSWGAVSGAEGYSVTRSGGSGGPSTKTTASTSYTDTGLTPDTTYGYQVTAYKGQIKSATVNISGKTIAVAPQKPTGLVVSAVTAGSVSLSWNSTAGAASYEVYRINYTSGVSTKIGTALGNYYTDYTVSPGTAYYYTVSAVNTLGSGPNSDRAFVYAANHNELTTQAQSLSVSAGSKQYLRLSVSAGKSYTITTSSSGYPYYIRCTAWQNDGTQPFSYTLTSGNNSRTFTSTAAGYITVEIANSYAYTIPYQIYYQEN
jgi:fibronectin type 3 domain-containing protein